MPWARGQRAAARAATRATPSPEPTSCVLIVPVTSTPRRLTSRCSTRLSRRSPHLPRRAGDRRDDGAELATTRLRVGPDPRSVGHGAHDFSLAFSPERVSSGRAARPAHVSENRRRHDTHSTAMAVEFYRAMLDAEIMPVRDAKTAEFSKLAETTYRDVNIALANEFARLADGLGVDVPQGDRCGERNRTAHPRAGAWASAALHPGVPVLPGERPDGDHRGGAAPRTTTWRTTRWVAGARSARSKGLIAVAGTGLPPGREGVAPFERVRAGERADCGGATVYVHDPLYTEQRDPRTVGRRPVPLAADALVVQAWHEQYAALDLRVSCAIPDGRARSTLRRGRGARCRYVGIGR
jgi:UDP-N-acetyl-D-mannosaminuronic acid dehydrogenase